MSRDANGTYNLPAGNPVVPATKIRVAWANPTMSDIGAALTDSLSRSGKGGMTAALGMGGFKINALAAALLATDAPQATQVRDQAFTWLNPIFSEATGNNYTGTALLTTPPVNGTSYQFLADRDNTGAMTLSVNGGASLPVLIHSAATPAGLILAGAVLEVTYYNLTWRLVSVSQSGGSVTQVQSDTPQVISVDNDFGTGIANLLIHAGVANGLCQLDSSVKVPVAQLPFTDIHYVGIWNAAPGSNPSATGINNGDFYIITVAGNLTIFRISVGNVYTAQATAVGIGDAIIRRVGSVDVNQPDGWYYDPAAASPAVASTVSMNPTPTLPAVSNVQSWMDQMDPIIDSKLPLAGGTMSGAIFQPVAPSTGPELANRQYVLDTVAGLVGVTSFNTRIGAVTLTSLDVTSALAYVPLNSAGGTISGNLGVTGSGTFSEGVAAKYFIPTVFEQFTTGALALDFTNGQSQVAYFTGNTTFSAVNNIPNGSIMRVVLKLSTFTVTWPVSVSWPLGVTPNCSAGPLKIAIVVFEKVPTGEILATATVY